MQEIRDKNLFFHTSDRNHTTPFNSLKEIIQDSLDNNKPMQFDQQYKSEYSEFNTKVPERIIRQYLKFMKK